MFKEILELGDKLEFGGKLAPCRLLLHILILHRLSGLSIF